MYISNVVLPVPAALIVPWTNRGLSKIGFVKTDIRLHLGLK